MNEQIGKKDVLVSQYEDYEKSNQHAKEAIESVSSGEVLLHILHASGGNPATMQEMWKDIWEQTQQLIRSRNEKLEEFKTCLRSEINLDTSMKGPDGRPTVRSVGPFTVSSTTKRSFDGEVLLDLLAKVGLKEEFLSQRVFDKDGKEVSLVSAPIKVDYPATLNWLTSKGVGDIIKKAYVEVHSTPKVEGDKTIGILGETVG